MTLERALLLLQAAATAYMTGLVWFVQLVHYPLFQLVPPAALPAYEARHQQRTGWVVAPPMLLELVTTLAALRWRPPELPAAWAWAGATLLGIIWASTAFVQVPLHDALEKAHDASRLRTLVASNWVRTVAWTARAILVGWGLARLLRAG